MSCCDSPDREIFCKLCYAKNFGPHGYGWGGSGSLPALVAAKPGEGAHEETRALIDFHPGVSDREEQAEGDDGCPRCRDRGYKNICWLKKIFWFTKHVNFFRCNYRVFTAEKMMAGGKVGFIKYNTCTRRQITMNKYSQ